MSFQEDDPIARSYDSRLLLRLLGYLRPYKLAVLVSFLLILAGFRIFRRDAGSLSVSDLLVVVLIADAAQNGMAGEYRSLTEGAIVVGTIFA